MGPFKTHFFGRINLFNISKPTPKLKPIRKPNPELPGMTTTQTKILQAIEKGREVIGGSFAQKALYPTARPFNDIDVISQNPKRTAENIQAKLRISTTAVMGRHGKYTIKHKGKVIADVVPASYYEKYIKQHHGNIPSRDVNGVKVLREDVLYREKKRALEYGNPKIREKLIQDIEFLEQ